MCFWVGYGPCPYQFVVNNAFVDENSRFLFDDIAFYNAVLPAADIAYLGGGTWIPIVLNLFLLEGGIATNITTPANVLETGISMTSQ
jgi:hypothetical protein